MYEEEDGDYYLGVADGERVVADGGNQVGAASDEVKVVGRGEVMSQHIPVDVSLVKHSQMTYLHPDWHSLAEKCILRYYFIIEFYIENVLFELQILAEPIKKK